LHQSSPVRQPNQLHALRAGLVLARHPDGGWSAPCALGCVGIGWGLQIGGELQDVLLVLRTPEALRAFCGAVQIGLGGGIAAAVGPLGRNATAALHVRTSAVLAAVAHVLSDS
jgi:lipid-binding SYLF domain-containing protein